MYRVRIFAGPNGSGKSTLYKKLEGQFNLGHYINPDDVYEQVYENSALDLSAFGITTRQQTWETFWKNNGLAPKAPLLKKSRVEKNVLLLPQKPKSYEAAILAAFLRHQLLKTGETFSFETVFSHLSKLDFMKHAHKSGYKCYLYFAAVSSPDICVSRVKQRVRLGGHDVPEDRIRSRYQRTLEHLFEALRLSHRAYLFNNSSKEMKLVAEMSPDKYLTLKGDHVPVWLEKHVLDKILPN